MDTISIEFEYLMDSELVPRSKDPKALVLSNEKKNRYYRLFERFQCS